MYDSVSAENEKLKQENELLRSSKETLSSANSTLTSQSKRLMDKVQQLQDEISKLEDDFKAKAIQLDKKLFEKDDTIMNLNAKLMACSPVSDGEIFSEHISNSKIDLGSKKGLFPFQTSSDENEKEILLKEVEAQKGEVEKWKARASNYNDQVAEALELVSVRDQEISTLQQQVSLLFEMKFEALKFVSKGFRSQKAKRAPGFIF